MMRNGRFTARLTACASMAAMLGLPLAAVAAQKRPPIMLDREGSFTVGGRILGDPDTASLHCDRGFVEYQIPVNARKVGLFLWHSSSTQVWQNRWDGGEGYQSIFLRRGYPVYMWDGPRVGRANWGCEDYSYKALPNRDQGNFTAWRFGPKYGQWFDGVQFPKDSKEAWDQATSARYDEFDTPENAHLQAAAAAKAIDRIGPVVLVTNSAGGWRALLAAMETQTGNVRAIVTYENAAYVFPEGEGPAGPEKGFGPTHVPLERFKKLTRFPIQFVFGDNLDKSAIWTSELKQAQQCAELINKYGGHAEVLKLTDAGLHGNTHIPFADMNNVAVADLLSQFLKKNKLDVR